MSGRNKVLLVEDDPDEAALVGECLVDSDFELCLVASLAAALAHLNANPVDAVLLDLGLPDASGLDGLKRLITEHPDAVVVVLTGSDSPHLVQGALAAGAWDYLFKGELSPGVLERTLRYVLQHARLRAEAETQSARLAASLAEREAALDVARGALQLRARFIDTVSHELRTPLTPILGHAQLLLKQSADPRQRTQLSAIVESALRLQSVVDGILRFQSPDAEVLHEEAQATDVRALLEAVCSETRRALGDKPVAVHIEASPGAPVMLHAKATLRSLQLLARNAAAFTDAGSISLRAELEGELILTVADTGLGIDEAHHERIFEPFFQVEPGLGACRGGLGLGLGQAKKLARALGGDLMVDSELGAGARFTLRLPPPGATR